MFLRRFLLFSSSHSASTLAADRSLGELFRAGFQSPPQTRSPAVSGQKTVWVTSAVLILLLHQNTHKQQHARHLPITHSQPDSEWLYLSLYLLFLCIFCGVYVLVIILHHFGIILFLYGCFFVAILSLFVVDLNVFVDLCPPFIFAQCILLLFVVLSLFILWLFMSLCSCFVPRAYFVCLCSHFGLFVLVVILFADVYCVFVVALCLSVTLQVNIFGRTAMPVLQFLAQSRDDKRLFIPAKGNTHWRASAKILY